MPRIGYVTSRRRLRSIVVGITWAHARSAGHGADQRRKRCTSASHAVRFPATAPATNSGNAPAGDDTFYQLERSLCSVAWSRSAPRSAGTAANAPRTDGRCGSSTAPNHHRPRPGRGGRGLPVATGTAARGRGDPDRSAASRTWRVPDQRMNELLSVGDDGRLTRSLAGR